MATVSFILRYYNEEKYIGECLNAIARQKGGHDIQIILINDKSTDRSDEVITSFKTDNPQLDILKIDLESKFTFSSAINKAIPYIKGEYSVIHSVHATLATDEWLDIILKNFVNKDVAITYGRLIVRKDANTQSLMTSLNVSPPYKIVKSAKYFTRSGDEKNAFAYINLNTCNCLRSDLLKKYRFRELPSVEDMDLGKRLLEDGYTIVYEPEAIVWHSHNDSVEKMVNRWINAAVGMRLIFTGGVPGRLSILKSTIPSYSIFMSKVMLKEKNIFMKMVYFGRIWQGTFMIMGKVWGGYREIKKWEGLYKNNNGC